MNKKILIYLLVFVIGIISGAGGYSLFFANSSTVTSSATAEKSSSEKKILYYRAPMNPNEVYDAPGESRMGMKLVPVYADESGSAGVVTVDGAVMQSMNVKIEHVNMKEMSSIINTNGILFTDERVEYTVNTKVGGWIEKLYINYTGQEVKKEQKLVDIYSPELVAAQQELLTAVAYEKAISSSSDSEILESGSDLVQNAIRKLELYDISKSDIEKLIETKNVTKLMTIYAPFDGTVITKKVNEGEKIHAGMEITKIADLTNLWLKADIYESELNKIKLGSAVEVSFTYRPDKIYKGNISFIYPTVNPKTRTIQIRIDLKNKSGELKPSMFGNVKIIGINYGMQPTVPETAVLRSGMKSLVMLALGEGRFRPVEVKLGLYSDGYYVILDGVKEGEMIVKSAQFMLDSESNLRAAVQLFSSSDADEHINMDHENMDANKEKYDTQNMDMGKSKDSKMDMDMDMDMDHKHSSIIREGKIDVKAIDTNGDGKVFQDVMDWNVISDKVEKCPICGMTLREVSIEKAKSNLKENGFELK